MIIFSSFSTHSTHTLGFSTTSLPSKGRTLTATLTEQAVAKSKCSLTLLDV